MEIIETTPDGRYRVGIEQDADAQEPYDDGGSPIIRFLPAGGYVEQVSTTSFVLPLEIREAASRFDDDPDLFERYLKMFHGTTSIEWFDSRGNGGGDYVYVTFDTFEWRVAMGQEGIPTRQPLADMSEWRAYVEGDVYGYVVQENVTWTTEAGYPDRESWEHVDSCWGFYGETEYLKSTALEALAYAVRS